MKTIDIRFSIETIDTIRSLIGQRFESLKHDPFIFSPSVYGIVGMVIGGKSYTITNQVEVLDYYGKTEDVAVFHFQPAEYESIESFMDEGNMIEYPVENRITEIRIVNENQRLFHHDEQIYDVYTVRGIIFVLEDGREISFEKPIWFSEEIYIQKGYDLIEKFAPFEEFAEGWNGDYHGECSREITVIS